MAGQITPLSGKLALFSIAGTVYQWTRWTLRIKLNTGEVLHFDGLTDGAGNYWPTVYTNWAGGEGQVSGFVNAAVNPFPVSTAGAYINSSGSFFCGWSATNGFTFPGIMDGNDFTGDAAATDPAALDCAFKMTGPPTRVYS